MKYIELTSSAESFEKIQKIAQNVEAEDVRFYAQNSDGMQISRLLVSDEKLQETLDAISQITGTQLNAKVIVIEIESYLPVKQDEKERIQKKSTASREAIYENVSENARINYDFIVLVILSTIVATIGLIENSVAVIIGAMVIAPLLGPNIALSLATALGDVKLMVASAKSIFLGIGISIAFPFLMTFVISIPMENQELLARTHVGFDSVVLALASGAAAALSVTTGLSSVLVGVMVAVALLPPAAVFGLMLGSGNIDLAINAGILLTVNIASVNLASKIVFLMKGITPRSWFEKEKAKNAMTWYLISWILALAVLLLLIYFRDM